MNTISDARNFQRLNWSALVMFALGFWLSTSLLLDAVIIPSLSAAGMMNQAGFASAGYLLFGIFNRIELVCAAIILTGFLAFGRHHFLSQVRQSWSIALATLLLVIPLIYTYILTPQMSSLGLSLNLVDTAEVMSPAMISMHGGYWVLEIIKFLAGATLLRWCYRDSCQLV
jgi:hypothetical protein